MNIMETIRTETPARITREVRVDGPRQDIIEKKEESNPGLWVVVGIIALLIFSQGGGGAGCSQGRGGRGGWQGGNPGHGGHGPGGQGRGETAGGVLAKGYRALIAATGSEGHAARAG